MTDTHKRDKTIIIATSHNDIIETALRSIAHALIYVESADAIIKHVDLSDAQLVIIDDLDHCKHIRQYITIPIMLIHDDIDAAIMAGADDCVRLHPMLIRLRAQTLLSTYRYGDLTVETLDHSETAVGQELTTILDISPDHAFIVNKNGTYILRMIGSEQVTSNHQQTKEADKTVYDTLPKKIADRILKLVHSALDNNTEQDGEEKISQEGDIVFYKITVSPVSDTDCSVVLTDITQQRQIEAILKRSEKNYERLFENATDAIFTIDVMTGKILQANPQASIMLGYSREALLSMVIDEIESDDIEIQDDRNFDFNSTDKLIVETRYKHRDGHFIDVEISSRVILQNKQLILISFVRDISEHKRALTEAQHQRNLSHALLTTANALNEAPDLDTVLETILTQVSQIIPSDSANIMQIKDNSAHITKHLGYDKAGFTEEDISKIILPLDKADNLRWVEANNQTLRIEDTHNSPYFKWVDGTTTSGHVKSIVTAPLIMAGVVQGFINVDSTKINNFTLEQERQLMAFANQAAIAIQRTSMINELKLYTGTLEKRVEERTLELTAANLYLEQIQEQMVNERNLLRLIIDTIPDAIYVKDTEQRFLIANQATYQNMDMVTQESDLIGKTDADLYLDKGLLWMEEEREIIRTGIPQLNNSVVYHNADGTIAHLIITKIPLIDATGKTTGLIGVNHDITQLSRTEARLEQVIKSARCLLWSALVRQDDNDPEKFTYDYQIINEQAAQTFLPLQQETDSSYTTAWLNATSAKQKETRLTLFKAAINEQKDHYRMQYPLTSDDGEIDYWLNEDVLIETIEEGVWSMTGVCTDISMHKVVEEQLQNINELLESRVATRTLELKQANADLVAEIKDRENAQASERQQRLIAEALRDGIAKLTTTRELDAVFAHLLTLMKSIIPHDASMIMLIEGDEVVIDYALNFDESILGLRLQIADMPDIQHIQSTHQAHIIADKDQYTDWQEKDVTAWVKSIMGLPIIIDNHVGGIINLYSKDTNHFSDQQAEWLVSFGEQVGLAILNARYTTDLEKMINQRTSELKFEQEQLKAILNGVADGVIYTDLDRKPQYINKALTSITGYSEEAWLSGQAQLAINDETLSLDKTWDRILHWLKTNTIWTGETEIKRKDGSFFDAGLARTTVDNHKGETVGVVTVIRDISDEKRLEEQKERFITKAAHELRTPIANLKTRLFLMKRRPDKFKENMAVADSVINLMQNLVEHMFDLSRFERGMMEMMFESINLQELLQEVTQYQKPQAERMSVDILLELPDQTIMIDADPYRLTQVITNLIGNALKHTRNNSNIIIRVSADTDHVLIDVIDHGMGIEKDHLSRLFQPFYQASDDQTGVGLGLAIVQEIVKGHNGTINVESELNQGTTFHIHLPLVQTKNDKEPSSLE